jgi:precorrin-2 dehydrogenase/sirohydrochlorin ferrochelatase
MLIMTSSYYPLMVDLRGKSCLVVGGGRVAERKIGSLLEAGAGVTVIAPVWTEKIGQWAAEGSITMMAERYGDHGSHLELLAQSLLVFAATDSPVTNRMVADDGQALHKLVSIADDSDGSGFIVPAVVRRGKLLLTVSTSGASPGLAVSIKRELEERYGAEYGPYTQLFDEIRNEVQRLVPDTEVRQQLFRESVKWNLLNIVRSEGFDELKRQLLDLVTQSPTMGRFEQITEWLRQHQ